MAGRPHLLGENIRMNEKEKLIQEIESQSEADFNGGRTNHLSELVCSYGAIVASFLAAILAGVSSLPGVVVATAAALPGLFTALKGSSIFAAGRNGISSRPQNCVGWP